MSHIEESIEVSVPVRTAYERWTHLALFPRVMGGVEQVEQFSDDVTHWVTRVDGIRREFDARITERTPNERIAWRSVRGTELTGVVTFHAVEEHASRLVLQLDHAPVGVVEILGDWFGFVSHQVQRDLRGFKHFVESEPLDRQALRLEQTSEDPTERES